MRITEEYIGKLKSLVAALHQRDENTIAVLSAPAIRWKVEQEYGNLETINRLCNKANEEAVYHNIRKIVLHKTTVFKITDDIVQVSGDYDLVCTRVSMIFRICYEILATYQNGMLLYLQLFKVRGNGSITHIVRATNEDCYRLDENEGRFGKMANNDIFSQTDIAYVHRVVIGNDNPEQQPNEDKYQQQVALLNRCLSDYPKGKIIGQEKNFYILNIGEHQVVMQYIVYHVGFSRKPTWI